METLFLACFAFGVLFTFGSMLLGFVSGIGHGGDGGGGTDLGGHAGADSGHIGHGHTGGADHGGHTGDGQHGLGSLLSVYSISGFLTWFGAAGYLLTRFAAWPVFAVTGASIVVGGFGGAVIALFIARLRMGEREMDPDDYRLEGTIARVTVAIPENGVGEILFSKAGTRRVEAARSLDGGAISDDAEVVIMDYKSGVAGVQPWDAMMAARESRQAEGAKPPPEGPKKGD